MTIQCEKTSDELMALYDYIKVQPMETFDMYQVVSECGTVACVDGHQQLRYGLGCCPLKADLEKLLSDDEWGWLCCPPSYNKPTRANALRRLRTLAKSYRAKGD